MIKRLVNLFGIVSVALVILAGGCASGGKAAPVTLATVGCRQITGTDVSYKTAIEKAYGNETAAAPAVLAGLIDEAIEHEVGRMWGLAVTSDELAALSKHADQTTKEPEILAKVKQSFSGDQAGYERMYLAPKIMNRKLRAWYSRNAEIHKDQRALIEKAYYLAQSGKSLEQSAKDCGLDFSTGDYGKHEGETPALLKQYMPQDEKSLTDPMMSILESMSQGEIYNNIVENDDSYKVIKLVQKNDAQYKVETITAEKRSFDKWFRQQAQQVKVKILDAELKKKVASKYPHLWWIKEVHNEKTQKQTDNR